MIDFEKAKEDAFTALQTTLNISVLSIKDKKVAGWPVDQDVWRVATEIFLPDGTVTPIVLFIKFPYEFPLVLPKIYLSKEDYQWIRHIPHVNVEQHVCLFDDETITIDPAQPVDIIKSCLRKAKQIIQDGLQKKNVDDFSDEFLAYWNDEYSARDKIVSSLSIISKDEKLTEPYIKFAVLNKPYRIYSYIIFGQNDSAKRFRSYLEAEEYKISEVDALYLGELKGLEPPFILSNQSAFELVTAKSSLPAKTYEQFIKKSDYPKVVLFSVLLKSTRLFFGWTVGTLNTERKGFRPGYFSKWDVYKTIQKHDPVTRLSFADLSRERLHDRTDSAVVEQKKYTLAFAGTGSIGSNLMHHLYTSEVEKLLLIDPDVLTIENINRHLLGLSYVQAHKVAALEHFFTIRNPFLQVATHQTSVIKLVNDSPEILNSADYLFVAIGKTNIEEYLVASLREGRLTKPMFILWVEPFLIGAHCLLINPGTSIDYQNLYADSLYKYNVLSEDEYKDLDRQLLFREAGCQSSYVPYGQKSITLFLAGITPIIFDLMENRPSKNLRITWKGNAAIQKKLGLKLSTFGQRLEFGQTLIEDL